jgi:hypothetical protein
MNINELTIGQAREISSLFNLGGGNSSDDSHWVVGKNYFIRTVTHHHTGELVAVKKQELILKRAAWIADGGRFQQALESGNFNEVEMFPPNSSVIIGRAAIIDAVEISNIPTCQK